MIADDHPLSREGLALAVRHAIPGISVVGAGTIAEAEAIAAKRTPIALVLLDLMLPDTTGFAGLVRLKLALPRTPIVVVTAKQEPELAAGARELGASGFLPKSSPLDEIAQALRKIAAGETVFPAIAAVTFDSGLLSIRDRIASLSDAQRRVLFALASGHANKRIAYDLSITEATVKAHLTAIFRRLGVTNRLQAMLALQPLLDEPEHGA